MAEPLVNQYGADVPQAIARMVSAVHPAFDSREFVADVLQGYDHYREDLALAPTSTGGIWQLAGAPSLAGYARCGPLPVI
ncbi:hypothetical protein [Polaromonas sp.]|uniref:hypothetical protein n=1 Tax=Polaromonas sp. TaxID=1869339 RepID=UPI00356732C7